MMGKEKIKVLLVDDAALMKVVISNILSTDPGIMLVGQASNGQEALSKLDRVDPDVILLDIEMPVMDGLGFLKGYQKHPCKARVIVLSSIAKEREFEVKQLGASAVLNKPSGAVSMDLAEKTGAQLLNTIHRMYRFKKLTDRPVG
jgi:chemotaxis response regulator CheB